MSDFFSGNFPDKYRSCSIFSFGKKPYFGGQIQVEAYLSTAELKLRVQFSDTSTLLHYILNLHVKRCENRIKVSKVEPSGSLAGKKVFI